MKMNKSLGDMLDEDDAVRLAAVRQEQANYDALPQSEKDRLQKKRDALVARDEASMDDDEED
jgi:hypothetical protein